MLVGHDAEIIDIGKQIKIRVPNATDLFMVPSTPSDFRAEKNQMTLQVFCTADGVTQEVCQLPVHLPQTALETFKEPSHQPRCMLLTNRLLVTICFSKGYEWPFCAFALYTSAGVDMLKKHFIRDGNRRITASVTTGYSDTSSIVRDQRDQFTGRTNERFNTVRDAHGNLVSTNSADPGIVIGRTR